MRKLVFLAGKTRVYADKGYTSKANSDMLKERHFKDGNMNRAYRNKPLTKHQQNRNLHAKCKAKSRYECGASAPTRRSAGLMNMVAARAHAATPMPIQKGMRQSIIHRAPPAIGKITAEM